MRGLNDLSREEIESLAKATVNLFVKRGVRFKSKTNIYTEDK